MISLLFFTLLASVEPQYYPFRAETFDVPNRSLVFDKFYKEPSYRFYTYQTPTFTLPSYVCSVHGDIQNAALFVRMGVAEEMCVCLRCVAEIYATLGGGNVTRKP